MKKTALYIIGITLISLTLINCGSTKKGCGLSSDATKIEQVPTAQASLIAEK
ncbi:hypothetical protein [Lutibacter sp. HS1-25]|uniref:hypothetical protein n=1 Tax=Lutibacter sp. HS1-25 TaxID=2485000 RepID=UPI0013E99041|nr:hypothetical protein [Lutibacter sp. HS1-25]